VAANTKSSKTKYQPSDFEPKWQRRWAEQSLYSAQDDSSRPNYYNLVMFPYPSGELHIGHWYNYTGADIYGRFMRMRGYNVSQPIGFDAFGLPAENAAIKRNIQPRAWTMSNIEHMRRQLHHMGGGWDWPREVITCQPEYYRWNQWLFLQFYKHGLAYRTKAPANWCPTCNTTLANEQVVSGACERCKTPVERREIDQWLFRITKYADELLRFDGLDWPEKTRLMQTNWIGKSEGAEIRFRAEVPEINRPEINRRGRRDRGGDAEIGTKGNSVASSSATEASAAESPSSQTSATSASSSASSAFQSGSEVVEIPVFTTRPDTIYGVTFFVLAPEHPLVERLTTPEQKEAVAAYVEQARRETEIERMSTAAERPKTGVPLGSSVINPVSGAKAPIWIADYVLMGYGTGAVMGVPAHDQRDFEFARAFGLPTVQVIAPVGEEPSDPATWEAAKSHSGVMVNSGPFNGVPADQAIPRVIAWLEERGVGKGAVSYRLRDWLISRQRYWGTPIPIVYCEQCGAAPVPESELPVVLPDHVQFKPTGESPLKYVPQFYETTCPECGGPATRETDTMDTFVDSAWYFLRYADTHNHEAPWGPGKVAEWLPVDMYIGGPEHATMHLLYARFFVKALRDMGLVSFGEPFTRLYHQGMVLGPDGQKMSKSRGNVIAPDDVVGRYGADAVRAYLMFMGPFDAGGPWSNQGIEGVWRFMNRVWALATDVIEAASDSPLPVGVGVRPASPVGQGVRIPEVERLRHRTIQRVTDDYAGMRFNTALSALMEYVNGLNKLREEQPDLPRDPRFAAAIDTLLVLLAPMAPFMAEELYHRRHPGLPETTSIHVQPWPEYDPALTVADVVTVVVQVNGKVREKLEVAPDITEEEVKRLALHSPRVRAAMDGREPKKWIYVADRHLANIVV
jgi:leucyl-tRNA synthetase